MQAKGATLFEVVYLDSGESVPVLVGIGDALVAAEWAKEQVPLPAKPELAGREPVEAEFLIEEYRAEKAEIEAERQHIAGLYACFLGAQRAHLPDTDHDHLYWLQRVTIPDDSAGEASPAADEEPAEGESVRPSSAA
ncbi:MAG: hypothetical protein QM323_04190 [Acidobacteriota bacterium]|nr:hypothetical protein [Acidobacteriota bacterium]